jgi:hypothetical protein
MGMIKGKCSKDGFPMVNIHGRLRCIAEYMDRCVGERQIVDVVQRDEVIYYVFENRHEVPLLCFCCGEPLAVTDLEASRQNMTGRRLQAMGFEPVTLEDGSDAVQFILEFSPKGKIGRSTDVIVSLDVAEKMIHPRMCKQAPRQRGKRTRKRK